MMGRPQKRDLAQVVATFVTPVEAPLRVEMTVAEAMKALRAHPPSHKIVYFYILDGTDRLAGVVSTRKLLLSPADRKLGELMDTPAIAVLASATLHEALEKFSVHQLLALPVVDGDDRLVGTIDVQLYAEEAIDLAESHRLHDLFQLLGLSVQEYRRDSAWGGFARRMPWLLCSVAGGTACAIVASRFQQVLAGVILLAMFIPLVLTLSESISMQSMSLTLYLLHGPNAQWRRLLRRGAKEWHTAVLLGLACAVCVTLVASLWGPGVLPVTVIGISVAASMVCAATIGVVLPVCLHVMKLDPHVASGPLVLMLGDVVTTTVYLGLATWLLI